MEALVPPGSTISSYLILMAWMVSWLEALVPPGSTISSYLILMAWMVSWLEAAFPPGSATVQLRAPDAVEQTYSLILHLYMIQYDALIWIDVLLLVYIIGRKTGRF